MLQQLPRLEFEAAVGEHEAERHARGFRCWTQFVAMLFCQLGHAQTLREVTGGLAACEGKLRHLGVDAPPKRSTPAYANERRPWRLLQTVFEPFYQRCRVSRRGQPDPALSSISRRCQWCLTPSRFSGPAGPGAVRRGLPRPKIHGIYELSRPTNRSASENFGVEWRRVPARFTELRWRAQQDRKLRASSLARK